MKRTIRILRHTATHTAGVIGENAAHHAGVKGGGIWPDAAMSGMKHFFVEQGGNFAVDAMTSAEVGAAYVKKFLLK